MSLWSDLVIDMLCEMAWRLTNHSNRISHEPCTQIHSTQCLLNDNFPFIDAAWILHVSHSFVCTVISDPVIQTAIDTYACDGVMV
jgi:hypothetical protein